MDIVIPTHGAYNKLHMDIRNLVCAVCKHQWSIRADRPNPLRCPAIKCRSVRWESGQDSRAGVKVFTVRVPAEQAAQFERRSKAEGKSTSEWLRDLGAAAIAPAALVNKGWAEETLKPGDKITIASTMIENPDPRRKTATELARVVDGELHLGADTPEEPARSWAEELDRLAALDEGDANEELLRLTSGDHPPSKFAQWHRNPKLRPDLASWLEEHDYTAGW